MTVKLKLFQCIQKFCKTMGFFPSQLNPRRAFRLKTLLYILPPIFFFVSTLIFLLTNADSIQEYDMAVFTLTSLIASIINILVMIWNMPKILILIGKFEEIIEQSKYFVRCTEWVYHSTGLSIHLNNKRRFDSSWITGMNNSIARWKYCNLINKIELLSEIYHFMVVKLTMPGVVLPAFLLTMINYFIYDLGNDSYFLPFPIVYV